MGGPQGKPPANSPPDVAQSAPESASITQAIAAAANAMPSAALPAGAEPGAAGGPGAAGEEALSLLSGQTAGPGAPGGPGAEGDPGQAGGDSGGPGAGAGDEDGLDDDPFGENGDDEFDEEDLGKPKPDKKKSKKPLGPAYVTAAVMLIIALLFGSTLFVARDQFAELWPGIKGVYEALNLDDDEAEGLRLSQPQPVRIMQAGAQTLVVTGLVTNLTDGLQTVPNLKLMLIDKNNNVVQETSAPPTAPTIDPNSTQPYRIELQLQLPVETAASLRVDWD